MRRGSVAKVSGERDAAVREQRVVNLGCKYTNHLNILQNSFVVCCLPWSVNVLSSPTPSVYENG